MEEINPGLQKYLDNIANTINSQFEDFKTLAETGNYEVISDCIEMAVNNWKIETDYNNRFYL